MHSMWNLTLSCLLSPSGFISMLDDVSREVTAGYGLQAPALELVKRVHGDLQRLDAS